ncbi:MAG: hypothetical protein ACPHVK_00585 [Akkermansiaceae bacterium]
MPLRKQKIRIHENLFISPWQVIYTHLLPLFLLSSCNDQELKKEDAQLSVQLEELEKQIETFKALAGNQPQAETATLAGISDHVDKARQLRDNLLAEKERLNGERIKLETEYADYREKYPLEE